ncbi:MAG: glycosyltransferase family 2 protein [Candidatus Gracilibacteria bacterium]|nr:glycosyltransferase family 2 protein [Candidatus Gracilibacteria bacterium]
MQTISIIIPTLGRKTLFPVLRRIVACDGYDRFRPEILVVFDGEVDPEKRKMIKKIDQKIKILRTKEKKFASGARNLGLEKATGDIIAFLGDDTLPRDQWLVRLERFHRIHPEKKSALLGRISWTPALARDAFHRWLQNNAQFAFRSIEKHGANFRHFYTSNISLKKALIEEDRFSEKFKGWGFEDIEFGYRMAQKGMRLFFDPEWEVLHDHAQTPEQVWNNTRNARKNAHVFESLHPELEVLPRGFRLYVLRAFLPIAWFVAPFYPPAEWWYEWKKNWLTKK